MGKGAKISVNAKVKKRIPYEMQLLPFGFPIVLWEYDLKNSIVYVNLFTIPMQAVHK